MVSEKSEHQRLLSNSKESNYANPALVHWCALQRNHWMDYLYFKSVRLKYPWDTNNIYINITVHILSYQRQCTLIEYLMTLGSLPTLWRLLTNDWHCITAVSLLYHLFEHHSVTSCRAFEQHWRPMAYSVTPRGEQQRGSGCDRTGAWPSKSNRFSLTGWKFQWLPGIGPSFSWFNVA